MSSQYLIYLGSQCWTHIVVLPSDPGWPAQLDHSFDDKLAVAPKAFQKAFHNRETNCRPLSDTEVFPGSGQLGLLSAGQTKMQKVIWAKGQNTPSWINTGEDDSLNLRNRPVKSRAMCDQGWPGMGSGWRKLGERQIIFQLSGVLLITILFELHTTKEN